MVNGASRFNTVAEIMGMSVRWNDANGNNVRDEGEIEGPNSQWPLVDEKIALLNQTAAQFVVNGGSSSTQAHPLVVGNPIFVKEIQEALKAHGNKQDSIHTKTPFDQLRANTNTALISDLNLDGDSHPDFLLVQSFEIFVAEGEEGRHETVSFLAAVRGNEKSDKSKNPDSELLKGAKILAIASYPDNSYPITGFDIKDENGDGIHEVDYRTFDEKKQEFVKHRADLKGKEAPNAQTLFDALFKLQAYYVNSFGYFNIVMGSEFDKGGEVDNYIADINSTFYNRLSFAFRALEGSYPNFFRADQLPFARVMIEEARKNLVLSEEDKRLEGKLKSDSAKLFGEERGKFEWNGKKMGREDYYRALLTVKDPKEREDMTKAYDAVTISAMSKEEVGLFSAIDKLNEMAARYGYKNYAEMVVKIYNFASVESFVKMMDDVYARRGAELEQFVKELEGLNGGLMVNEWDVPYLTEGMIRRETGLAELPRISVTDAMEAAKRFFKDIGIDTDAPPFAGNIFYDTKKRDNKYPNAFAESLGDGSRSWLNTNLDPQVPAVLKDVQAVFHEFMHNFQFIAGAKNAGGNAAMNSVNSQTYAFAEGLGAVIEGVIYEPVFMDRYLAGIKGFEDPAVRASISRVKLRAKLYEDMKIMIRARQEMELYKTRDENGRYRSVEERMEAMKDIAEKYLFVHAEVDKLDFWTVPHPTNGGNVYYSNYSLGRSAAEAATRDILAAMRGERAAEGAGELLLRVFEEGPRLRSLEDIQGYVSSYRP